MPLIGGVVEVRPDAVRAWSRSAGAVAVPADLTDAALAGVDDEYTLLADDVVPVAEVWRQVFDVAAAVVTGALALVVPSWWPADRTAVVEDAACAAGVAVVCRSRSDVVAEASGRRGLLVVEISDDLVVVSTPPEGTVWAESYQAATVGSAAAAVACAISALGESNVPVFVDRVSDSAGARSLAGAVAGQVDAVRVTVCDDDWVMRGAARTRVVGPATSSSQSNPQSNPESNPESSSRSSSDGRRPRTRYPAVAIGVGVAVVLTVLAAMMRPGGPTGERSTLLVEGRVVVEVPVSWHTRRIVDGPGSPRVRVTSPAGTTALHITAAMVPESETLSATAETLRAALAREPPGVFVDFRADDHRAGRAAVTYREIRRDHDVAWTVLLDGALRIAIGCQTARDRADEVRPTCERAIASARDLRTLDGTDSA